MIIIPGNAQDIGDRERQEDYFGFSSLENHNFERHGGVMMVLCDGMGGLANGAAASRAAVDAALSGYGRKQPSENIPSALDRALHEAHQAVCAICGESGNAGSTIVMAVVWQDTLYWASVGDSRLYLCRASAPAAQLTEDHNVASLMKEGAARGESHVRETDSATNPDALTAYLGAPYPPQPHTGTLPLRPGDRVIACTDGLYRGLSPEEMTAIARRGDPMSVAERMKASVLMQKLPHQDNLTVVLLAVSSPPDRLFQIFKSPGPTLLGAIYGAIGGFGAAVALAILLTVFGVLKLELAPPQKPPDPPVTNTQPSTPPPAPVVRDQAETPSSPSPSQLLNTGVAGQGMQSGGKEKAKDQSGNPSDRQKRD